MQHLYEDITQPLARNLVALIAYVSCAQAEGLKVQDVMVLIDREQGGAARMVRYHIVSDNAHSLRVHAAWLGMLFNVDSHSHTLDYLRAV